MPKHGTRSSYLGGCKCEPCKAAQSKYRRELRERKKREQAGQTVDQRSTESDGGLAAVRALPSTAPAAPTAPAPAGDVETAVKKQLANLAGADLQPGLAASAIAMARLLDDPFAKSQQPAAAARLSEMLATLGKAGRKTSGRLAAVQKMTAG